MEEVVVRTPQGSEEEEAYSILTHMVAVVSQDHAQLRMLVYEFARRRLRKYLSRQFEDGDWSGIKQQLHTLEAAIERVELDCRHKALTSDAEPPLTDSQTTLTSQRPWRTAIAALAKSRASIPLFSSLMPNPSPFQTVPDSEHWFPGVQPGGPPRSTVRWNLQLIAAALLGGVIYAAIEGSAALRWLTVQQVEAPTNVAPTPANIPENSALSEGKADSATVVRPNLPIIPIPNEYGVYAVSEEQLIRLEVLPIRVPDPRIAISTLISTPGQVHLPSGKLEFVVFRRDLADIAPDRVQVRVVAQVLRSLTFNSKGKPTIAAVENTWVVRSNSYEMRVGPVADHPEMILLRPNAPQFILPTGRYALVLKGVAYDFTIDGASTDAAHCLERTVALTSPVYNECRDL